MATFDPAWLMSQLQKGSGAAAPDSLSGSNSYNNFPSSNNSNPDTPTPPPVAPAADSQAPPSQPPSGAPPQAQQDPSQQRIQGVKGYLANILHGVGEGMKTELGMETDAQKQQRMFTQNLQQQKFAQDSANIQSEIAQRAATVKQMQSSVTLPNGMQVPFALAKPYIDAWGKQNAAATGKRYMIVPNVGMLDTQPEGGGSPQLVPGSSPAGTKVTPEMAQQFNIPLDQVGTTLPLGRYAQLEAAAAKWAPTSSTTQDHLEVDDPNNPGQKVIATFPKTTTSQKVAPNQGSSVMPTATPQGPGQQPVQPTAQGARKPLSLATNNGVKFLNGPDGQPLTKGGGDTVYAQDPKSGQTIFTTRSDAASQGLTNMQKVTPAQSRKDQALVSNVADIQRKFGDYADTFNEKIDDSDKTAIAYLMDKDLGGGLSAGGVHVSIIPGYVNSLLKAKGMDALSDVGMRRYVLYKQAEESLTALQQAKTGSNRSSDKVLDMHIEQLPPPVAPDDFAKQANSLFQQNIDLAAQTLPQFPGLQTQQSIKTSQAQRTASRNITDQRAANAQNPQSAAEPSRPSNVPANYIFKANGPKGTGWYRP